MKFRLIAAALILVVAVTAIATLWWGPTTVGIADVSKPTELTLRAKHAVRSVYALHVEGRGRINGEAEISLILNGQPYKTMRLSGPVHFSWRGDWYAPEAVVRYTPLTVTGGSVELRYRFGSP